MLMPDVAASSRHHEAVVYQLIDGRVSIASERVQIDFRFKTTLDS